MYGCCDTATDVNAGNVSIETDEGGETILSTKTMNLYINMGFYFLQFKQQSTDDAIRGSSHPWLDALRRIAISAGDMSLKVLPVPVL